MKADHGLFRQQNQPAQNAEPPQDLSKCGNVYRGEAVGTKTVGAKDEALARLLNGGT